MIYEYYTIFIQCTSTYKDENEQILKKINLI